VRVLLIGLGRWGQNHLRAWRRLGVELRLCDRRPERIEGLPEPAATDPDAFLGEVDAVDVVTPADSHAGLVARALGAGKHVFVEKPLAPDPEEAFRLAAAAEASRRVLHVGHIFRFAPELRAAREALAAGRIGRVRYLTSHFIGFKRPRSDGGVALSDAIHFVDTSSWLLGRQPETVSAVLHDHLGRGMDDVAFLTLGYGDATAHVEAGYFPPEPRRDLVAMGSDGAIVCDLLAKEERLRLYAHAHQPDGNGGWQAIEGERSVPALEPEEPLLAALAAFLETCEGRPSPVAADGRAGAAAVAVIEAARRSAQEQRAVEVKLPEPLGGLR